MTRLVVALCLENVSKIEVSEHVSCDIDLYRVHLSVIMHLLIPFKAMNVFIGSATTSFSRKSLPYVVIDK
jgi:hypothetical protein